MDKGLYKSLRVFSNTQFKSRQRIALLATSSIWHDRFGHTSQPIIDRVLKSSGIKWKLIFIVMIHALLVPFLGHISCLMFLSM